MSIEIKLSRFNSIYRPDDPLQGKVITKLTSGISYQSIRVTIDGTVNLQYLMTVDVVRGYLNKPLTETMEFIVESEKDYLLLKPVSPEMVIFYITQDTQRHQLLPELQSGGFWVTGKICTQCSRTDPIGGELTVETSAFPVQSIDIHLLRVESILIGEKIATESSLIQTTRAFIIRLAT